MSKRKQLLNRVIDFFRQALTCWFYPTNGWLSAWMNRIFFPALYLVGLYQWADFLNWGKIPFQLADWADITVPMLAVLKDAAHAWGTAAAYPIGYQLETCHRSLPGNPR